MSAAEIETIQSARLILQKHARTSVKAFTDPSAVKTYLMADNLIREGATYREEFKVLFLDSQHRLIAEENLFSGTIDAAPVYPRVIVQRALHHNSAAVMLAHNHPSGLAEPSNADKTITKRIQDALALIDIRVLDHFVVGDSEVVSFAERGYI
jgi:DNA repair protein RadC